MDTNPDVKARTCANCTKVCGSVSKLRQHMESCLATDVTCAAVQKAAAIMGAATNATHPCQPYELAGSVVAPERQAQEEPMAHTFARARIVNHVPRESVGAFKTTMSGLVKKLHSEAVEKLSPVLAAGVDADAAVAEVFRGVEESLQELCVRDGELKHVREHASYVPPVRRWLGCRRGGAAGEVLEDFYAYDSPLNKSLEAIFATRPGLWKDVKSFESRVKQRLRTSDKHDETARICDMIDGVEFCRFYMRLDIQPGEMPLVFIFYYDGLEVVNGLGQARLTHELACFYWALVPISDMGERLRPENLRLASVCLKRACTSLGMDVVINGRREDDETSNGNTSWGAQMQKLGSKEGMTLRTPDGERKFRGGSAVVAADTPAGAELFGVKKSVGPSTKSVCKGCHCMQHGDPPPYRSPNSFLCTIEGWKRVCPGRQQKFKLRSINDFKDYLHKLEALRQGELTEADLENWKQEVGVNDFLGALWRCPFLSLTAGCPMDMMHVLFEGTARALLGALSYVMIRRWGIDEDDMVLSIGVFAKQRGEKRAKYPHVNSSRIAKLKDGSDLGVCKPDCDFPGTAMQVGTAATDSDVIAAW